VRRIDATTKRGSPRRFGLDPADVASYLVPYHLNAIADGGNAEHQARYLRPLGHSLAVSEYERVVRATILPR